MAKNSFGDSLIQVAKDDLKTWSSPASAAIAALSMLPAGKVLSKAIKFLPKGVNAKTVKTAIDKATKPWKRNTVAAATSAYTSDRLMKNIDNPNVLQQIGAGVVGSIVGGIPGGIASAAKGISKRIKPANAQKTHDIIVKAAKDRHKTESKAFEKHGAAPERYLTNNKIPIDLSKIQEHYDARTLGLDAVGLESFMKKPEAGLLGRLKAYPDKKVPHGTVKEILDEMEKAGKSQHAFDYKSSSSGRDINQQRRIVKKAESQAIAEHLGKKTAAKHHTAKKRYASFKHLEDEPFLTKILNSQDNLGEPFKHSLASINEGAYIPKRVLDMIRSPDDKAYLAKQYIKQLPGVASSISHGPKAVFDELLKKATKPAHHKPFYAAAKSAKSSSNMAFLPAIRDKNVESGDSSDEYEKYQEMLRLRSRM